MGECNDCDGVLSRPSSSSAPIGTHGRAPALVRRRLRRPISHSAHHVPVLLLEGRALGGYILDLLVVALRSEQPAELLEAQAPQAGSLNVKCLMGCLRHVHCGGLSRPTCDNELERLSLHDTTGVSVPM